MFRRDLMVRQISDHSFVECGLFVVDVAQVTTALHRTVPPFFWLSTLPWCDSCSFFHSANGPFCHSFRFGAMRGARVMITF